MVAVVKYNAGNIGSLTNALARLGQNHILTDDPEVLLAADKVIFPGVGEAGSAMRYLRARRLDEALVAIKQPFLGICLGLQLMCAHSEEGDTPCLGIFSEYVRKFPEGNKVPHIGWNNFRYCKGALFEDIDPSDDVYFVHSFFAAAGSDTIAETHYGVPFSAALQKDNFFAVQFHPEKSAQVGEKILKNFLAL